jgi:hypothetical protein
MNLQEDIDRIKEVMGDPNKVVYTTMMQGRNTVPDRLPLMMSEQLYR